MNCNDFYFPYIIQTAPTIHLLRANIDIRTIQKLLGHSDLKTAMIYTYYSAQRDDKEAKRPLDFGKRCKVSGRYGPNYSH